jgi:hypothetical protein
VSLLLEFRDQIRAKDALAGLHPVRFPPGFRYSWPEAGMRPSAIVVDVLRAGVVYGGDGSGKTLRFIVTVAREPGPRLGGRLKLLSKSPFEFKFLLISGPLQKATAGKFVTHTASEF